MGESECVGGPTTTASEYGRRRYVVVVVTKSGTTKSTEWQLNIYPITPSIRPILHRRNKKEKKKKKRKRKKKKKKKKKIKKKKEDKIRGTRLSASHLCRRFRWAGHSAQITDAIELFSWLPRPSNTQDTYNFPIHGQPPTDADTSRLSLPSRSSPILATGLPYPGIIFPG